MYSSQTGLQRIQGFEDPRSQVNYKSEPQNIEQGITNIEGKTLNNSTFLVRYSIFDIRFFIQGQSREGQKKEPFVNVAKRHKKLDARGSPSIG